MRERRRRFLSHPATAVGLWTVAAALPLVGIGSLLLRSQLDAHLENYRAHFLVFGAVGGFAFALGSAAGEAAERRGDSRVLLLSLAFMATGGFLGLHARRPRRGPPGVAARARRRQQRRGGAPRGRRGTNELVRAYVLLALP